MSARIRQEWSRSAAWALLGLALLAGMAGPSAFVPGKVATEEAFLAARPCHGETAAPDVTNCTRTTRGTVLSVESAKSGRATVFRVRLRPPMPAPADQPIDLDRHGDLSERIKPGEQVEVTTWRNVLVAVSQDGVRETLPGLPDEDATVFVAVALMALWSAALAFVAAFGAGRRARRLATGRPALPRVSFGGGKGVGVIVVPAAAAFCAGHFWDAWTAVVMTVIVWAVVAVPVTVLALYWDREPSPASSSAGQPDAELERSN
ncbi:hypothetical protein [Streptomyces sp. NPDC091209]|uniref:hypothetical protein n=1 Tax=Streptomyces sp. NPDC091209 TaxID=3365974 RepID=UPI0038289DE3